MKKSAWVGVFLLVIILAAGFVSAAENTTEEKIDRAYDCLKEQISKKDKLTLQEAIFSGLALGWEKKVKEAIENEKGNNCWPKSGCKVKDTGQIAIVYDKIGGNNELFLNWVANQNLSSSGLNWFIEIDLTKHEAGTCTIKYGSETGNIVIGSDMKLSGSVGSCLSVSASGYWLKMSGSSGCLDKEYEISCNADFISTKLYQKGTEGTVYVSSETHSASAGGTTTEKIIAKCLKLGIGGGGCDYEGTLWGVLALKLDGRDVSMFVPYLEANADDNKKYFPSAFLYLISGGDDKYGDITGGMKQNKYWELIASPYNKYYDSAVALMALGGTSAGEMDSAKEYFLTIQTPQGCWNSNNIRDTAFLLAAGWGRGVQGGGETGETGNATGGGNILCENSGKYCENPNACLEGGGVIDYGYDCTSIADRCCSVKVSVQMCAEKNGRICGYNERCSVSEVEAGDGSCCLETCVPVESGGAVDDCSPAGGSCRMSCLDSEFESSESCANSGEVCCTSAEGAAVSEGISWWWIILLIILIILVVLGIIYRERIEIWYKKKRGKIKEEEAKRPYPHMGTGPMLPGRPAPPGRIMGPRGPIYAARQFMPFGRPGARPMGPARPVTRTTTTTRTTTVAKKPVSSKDKEMEETMKKLKEMSK